MTDNSTFSSDLHIDPSMDEALADIERAMLRFEQILSRHGTALSTLASGRLSSRQRRTTILRSVTQIARLFVEPIAPARRTDSNPLGTNRFPSSGGQILADLAASIRLIGGRNL